MSNKITVKVVDLILQSERGIWTEEICEQLECTPQELGDIFEVLIERGSVASLAGWWTLPERIKEWEKDFLVALDESHAKHPGKEFLEAREIATAIELNLADKPLKRFVKNLENRGELKLRNSGVRRFSFNLHLTPKQEVLLQRVLEVIEPLGPTAPFPSDIATEAGIPLQAAEEILRLGVSAGRLTQLGDHLFYSKKQLQAVLDQLKLAFLNTEFTVAQARDVLNSSRRFTHPLLEHLEKLGYLEKNGEFRKFTSEGHELSLLP